MSYSSGYRNYRRPSYTNSYYSRNYYNRKPMYNVPPPPPPPPKPRVSSSSKKTLSSSAPRKRSFNFKPLTSALGGIAGTFLGGPAGAAAGSSLGGLAGDLLGKITGLGDYKIQYNTLANNSVKLLSGDAVPAVQNTHTGVRICHREYITDISSSIAFSIQNYNINPGLSSTFPWLSAVAQNFQQYKLHGMIFTFVSTSADALNSTNTALGTVILGTNYNASSSNFSSKQQMENNEFTTSSKPSCNVMHMIECDPKQTLQEGKFYVRTGVLPANQDIKTYDIGNFQIATVGSQAVAVIGELHVSYDIELMKPIDLSITDQGAGLSHYYSNTNVNTSAYFGTVQANRFDNIGLTISTTGITFPNTLQPGQVYQVFVWYGGTAANVATPTITLGNCTQLSIYTSGSANILTTGGNTGSTVLAMNFTLRVSGTASIVTPVSFTFSGGTLPGSPVCELFVSQEPNSIA